MEEERLLKVRAPERPGRITVVFINGWFSMPNSYSVESESVPDNIDFVPVFPAPVGSLHDRACQIFYQLVGGRVDYGEEHSLFHKHDRFGRFEEAKLLNWNAASPIILVGHSYGGNTARVLQNYLAMKKFPGYDTDSSWVRALITVNSPLNGALCLYQNGMNLTLPTIIRVGSLGYWFNIIAHVAEYLDLKKRSDHADYQHDHFHHHWAEAGSFRKLLCSVMGFGLMASTDGGAWDLSIHGQTEWHKVLQTFPSCHYAAISGDIPLSITALLDPMSLHVAVWRLSTSEAVPRVAGVDTTHWADTGCDGALCKFTQEYPRLFNSAGKCYCAELRHRRENLRLSPHSSPKSESADRCNHCLYPQHPARPVLSFPSSSTRKRNSSENLSSVGSSLDDTRTHEDGMQEEVIQLERGLWHYTNWARGHFTTSMGCQDSWRDIFDLAELLASQPPADDDTKRANAAAEKRALGFTHTPDMIRVPLDMHCQRSSNGMAYRWGKLFFGCFCLALLGLLQRDELIMAGVRWTAMPVSMYLALCACLFTTAFVCLLLAGSRAYYHVPNHTFLLSDVVEIAYALHRWWELSLPAHGAEYPAPTNLPLSFLSEMVLLYFLPRPLFDNQKPIMKLAVLALLLLQSQLAASLCKAGPLLGYIAVLVILPRVNWLVIYVSHSQCGAEGIEEAKGALCFSFVMFSLLHFFVTWALMLLCLLELVFPKSLKALPDMRGIENELTLTSLQRLTFAFTILLLSLLPLTRFQEMSETFQFVLIKRANN